MGETKKKPKPARSDNYVETKRVGAVAANIFRRQAPGGFEYLDFSLSRAWKASSSGKEGYSQSFFANNRQALHEVIDRACDEIEERQSAHAVVQCAPAAVPADSKKPVNGAQSTAA